MVNSRLLNPECRLVVFACWVWLCAAGAAGAQQLVDRIVARVDGTGITLTDLQAAVGFGVIDPDAGDPLEQLIDRRLTLVEMSRRPPPPPDAAAIDEEVARMRAAAGQRLSELMAATGVDEARLREIARDSLMIRSYLDSRFPVVPASDADAEQYYRANPDAFTRNGTLRPFGEVAAEARRGAAQARRNSRIAGWLANLRNRMDVELVPRR